MQIKNQENNRVNDEFKLRSYKFVLGVMKLIGTLPDKKMYWSLGDQLFRSTSSIGANVVEAKSAASRKEFVKYFQIALRSANETKYWLCLVRDSKCGDSVLASKLLKEAEELANILAKSIITLKAKIRTF